MGILWTIVIGFVAGVVAKFIMPGDNEPSGFILTTISESSARLLRPGSVRHSDGIPRAKVPVSSARLSARSSFSLSTE